jgi:hypothetical protein
MPKLSDQKIDAEQAKQLAAELADNTTLEVLDPFFSNIDDGGTIALAGALMINMSLCGLRLRWRRGKGALMHTAFEGLSLKRKAFRDGGTVALADDIKLIVLDLAYTGIDNVGVRVLAQ